MAPFSVSTPILLISFSSWFAAVDQSAFLVFQRIDVKSVQSKIKKTLKNVKTWQK